MPSKQNKTAQRGFTLIEIIAVLLLVGILVSTAGFGLVAGVRGYLLASENAAMTQKAQMALTRLSREIQDCFDCDGPPGPIPLPFAYENHLGARELSFEAGTLSLDGNVLVDRVNIPNNIPPTPLFREDDQRITIALELNHLQGATTRTFTTSILPRNL